MADPEGVAREDEMSAPHCLRLLDRPAVTIWLALLLTLFASGQLSAQCIDYADYQFVEGGVDTPDFARATAVSGSYAYVAADESGLQIVDIADPMNPQIVGSVDVPGAARDVEIQDLYAYVAD